jgi:hypothetical protein
MALTALATTSAVEVGANARRAVVDLEARVRHIQRLTFGCWFAYEFS